MKNEKEYESLLKKAEYYCSRAEKCPFDINRYLSKYSDNDDIIKKIICELQSNGFLDTERYIKAFVNDKFHFEKWGKIKIAYNLKLKGLPEKAIHNGLNQIDKNEYLDELSKLVKSKLSIIRETDLFKRNAAIVRYCVSKGFEFDLIMKVLENLK